MRRILAVLAVVAATFVAAAPTQATTPHRPRAHIANVYVKANIKKFAFLASRRTTRAIYRRLNQGGSATLIIIGYFCTKAPALAPECVFWAGLDGGTIHSVVRRAVRQHACFAFVHPWWSRKSWFEADRGTWCHGRL